MVRRGVAVPEQCIAIRPPHKTIQQTVAMNVAAFLSAKNEPDSAEAMNPRPHAGQFVGPLFEGADRAQACRVKKRSRA